MGRRGVFQGPGVRHRRDGRLASGGLCGGHWGASCALRSLSPEEEMNLASAGAA